MANKLIGLDPNQVPSNADLGSAAYVDVTEFLTAKGSSLSKIDHARINAIVDNANDVFIYDTSLDSDGGAWRKRTQNTTWYSEELNTTYRGNRREFPSVAVIVGEDDQVVIYDADDPSFPMWMSFVTNASNGSAMIGRATESTRAVCALNGLMCVGRYTFGLHMINFITDTAWFKEAGYDTPYKHPIGSHRNDGNQWLVSGSLDHHDLVNDTISGIDMMVRKNAPIAVDGQYTRWYNGSGLPTPTIALATANGVSVIKDTGHVDNITESSSSLIDFYDVHFTEDERLVTRGDSNSQAKWVAVHDLTNTNDTYHYYTTVGDGSSFYVTYGDGVNQNVLPLTPPFQKGSGAPNVADYTNDSDVGDNKVYVGDPSGLGIGTLDRFSSALNPNMFAYITSDYNSGWLHSQTKLATLMDTQAGYEVKQNLITNGTFDSNSDWTFTGNNPSDFSISGGVLNIADNRTADNFATQTINQGLIQGQAYLVKITWNISVGDFDIRLGGGGRIFGVKQYHGSSGTKEFIMINTGSSDDFQIIANQHCVGTIDNIELYKAVNDRRSVSNSTGAHPYGLAVEGHVRKTAVAPGAELVAYDKFSTSNWLYQPYNSNLNFGTNDFAFICWFKIEQGANSEQTIMRRFGSGVSGGYLFRQTTSSQLQWFVRDNNDNTNYTITASGNRYESTSWHCAVCTREQGYIRLYIDGRLEGQSTIPSTVNVTDLSSNAITYFGIEDGTSNPAIETSLALIRFSQSVPSVKQINQMYHDEKKLFEANAKCTLNGTSDDAAAVSYDRQRKLLHVGTPQGRSVFSGLTRVDQTEGTSIATALDAVNGLVIEE
jgi:hypothetical protein